MNLNIPEGINYDCSGCGKCCGGWAVPMTEDDFTRISEVDWGSHRDKFKQKDLFRSLKDYEKGHTTYTHAIKPAADGNCPFLINNVCFIHSSFSSEFKPATCQLFPYAFIETPSGVFAAVSFVSTAVCYNSGPSTYRPKAMAGKKYEQFRYLYPKLHSDWSQLKFAVGQPMNWQDYLQHEANLLDALKDKSKPLEQRLLAGSDYLMSVMSKKAAGSTNSSGDCLKRLDKQLLLSLNQIYFPAKPLGRGEGDFSVVGFAYQSIYQGTRFQYQNRSFTFEELHDFPWAERDNDLEDLLYRYYYSRVFTKVYFGGGFGQLSLVCGFHHLILTYALVKMQAKASALNRGASEVSLLDLVPAVRQLEKRFGETNLNGYAAGLWELLMFSSARIKRVIASS